MTAFLWKNLNRFRCENVSWRSGQNLALTHRWKLEHNNDYKFIKTVYESLYPAQPAFSCKDILRLIEQQPELSHINDYLVEDQRYYYSDKQSSISSDRPDQVS